MLEAEFKQHRATTVGKTIRVFTDDEIDESLFREVGQLRIGLVWRDEVFNLAVFTSFD